MVRARLTIPAGVDNFTHTGALIDLGRAAGDRLLAEHLDSRFRVRPGLLELTLPETVSKPPVVAPRSPAEMRRTSRLNWRVGRPAGCGGAWRADTSRRPGAWLVEAAEPDV